MAAAFCHPKPWLLLIFYLGLAAASDRRFSDLKICADKECSMLLVRGKMKDDFSGPDCRFLSAKKSEIVYVYYKLGGRRNDIWAGSVGRQFGYFPKDLFEVNYVYTETELVLPTEETDFVCFDTGFNGHEDYDIDSLLRDTFIKKDVFANDTIDQIETAQIAEITSEPTDDPTDKTVATDNDDGSEAEEIKDDHVEDDEDDAVGVVPDASNNTDVVPEEQSANSLPSVSPESAAQEREQEPSFLSDMAENHTDPSAGVPGLENVELDLRDAGGEPVDDTVEPVQGEEPAIAGGGTSMWTEITPETLMTFETTMDEVAPDNEGMDTASHNDQTKDQPIPEHHLEAGAGSTSLWEGSAPKLQTTSQTTPETVAAGDEETGVAIDKPAPRKDPEAGSTSLWKRSAPGLRVTFQTTAEEVANKDDETGMASPRDEAQDEPVHEKNPEPGVGSTSLWTKSVPEILVTSQITPDEAPADDDAGNVIPVDGAESEEQIKDGNTDMDELADTPLPPSSDERTHVPESPPEEVPDQIHGFEKNKNDNEEEEEEEEEDDDDDDDDTDEENEDMTAATEGGWSSLGDTVFAIVSGGKRVEDVSSPKELADKAEAVTPEESQITNNTDVDVTPAGEPEEVEPQDLPDEEPLIFLEKEPEDLGSAPLLFAHQKPDDGKHAIEQNDDQEHGSQLPAMEESPQEEILTAEDPSAIDPHTDPSSHRLDAEAQEEPTEMREHPEPEEKDVDEGVGGDSPHREGRNGHTAPHAGLEARRLKVEELLTRHQRVMDVKQADAKESENETHQSAQDGAPLQEDSEHSVTERERDDPDEPDIRDDDEEEPQSKEDDTQEEEEPEVGQLLEDENALLYSESNKEAKEPSASLMPEPEYGDDILRLTLMRAHFSDEDMHRLRKFLSLADLLKTEALYADLDLELQAARLNDVSPAEDIEKSLDAILEASENTILDEIEKMVDSKDHARRNGEHTELFDEEAALLDEFQELGFKLRQKYSAAIDSTPLAVNDKAPPNQDDLTSPDPTSEVSEEGTPPPGAASKQEDPPPAEKNASAAPSHEEGAGAAASHEEGAGAAASHEEGAGAAASHEEGAGAAASHEEGAGASHEEGAAASHEEGAGAAASHEEGAGAAASHEEGASAAAASHEEGAGAAASHEEGAGAAASHEEGAAASHEEGAAASHREGAAASHGEGAAAEQGGATEGPDLSVEDGGHFNRNEDNQPGSGGFGGAETLPKGPPAVLEKPFDLGLGEDVGHSAGSMDPLEPVEELNEELQEGMGFLSSGLFYSCCLLSMIKTRITNTVIVMVSLLPEEWRPAETLLGCPMQAVIVTALVGLVTVIVFIWNTILAVKKKEYLVTDKWLKDQITSLKKGKEDAILRVSQLQKQIQELHEKQKQSEETACHAQRKNKELERKLAKSDKQTKRFEEDVRCHKALLEEQRANNERDNGKIEQLTKANEKLQLSRNKSKQAYEQATIFLDEAKLQENARSVQQKCQERDFTALKEQNKQLKASIKGWEDKHEDLSKRIKLYQKSQKELEDLVTLKDHNVEVLSNLLGDLDAFDIQKGDPQALANGEVPNDKATMIKNRIKQLTDVSLVQTTLFVVEEERNGFRSKFLLEEKTRKALEEKHQELEHSIATLKSEKSLVENQFKMLEQKNEILTEMYQQKQNALQQKLTKEEMERRNKESLLSTVGGKTLEAETQVKLLRQRIGEMDEQMKKAEVAYKEQIKEQENKTHSNWMSARTAERAVNQEKVETSRLRDKLALLSSQLNEYRAHLFKPNPGQVGARQGDSYGPSPVSVGAPSPPTRVEDPRRAPSAPLGDRRLDRYGPRPPSDPHGRYHDNKHPARMDVMGPRTSSPATRDDSGPGSFSSSAIMGSPSLNSSRGSPYDAPAPLPPQGAPRGGLPPQGLYGPPHHGPPHHGPPHAGPMYPQPPPHGMMGPRGPPPPPLQFRPPGCPANGAPPPPGYISGEYGPRPANGHAPHPRPEPRGPPQPPHLRQPLPPHHDGPHGLRGPAGPRPPYSPDMRYTGPPGAAYPPGPAYPPQQGPRPDGYADMPPRPTPPTAPGPRQGPPEGKRATPPQDSVNPLGGMTEP